MESLPPKHCPGVGTEESGKASACAGCPNQKICSSGDASKDAQTELDTVVPLMVDRLKKVKHIILVISGKGGTGKSTVSTMLARALATDPQLQVGLLDLDLCGPSVPRMFDLEGEQVHKSATGWVPVYAQDNLGIMSCGFLLDSLDDAVIWRGPKKNELIKQFLMEVDWEKLDYLIIDTPPGTSDEHISVVQYLKQTKLANLDGALMVSTPQEVSLMDVRKQIDFCQRIGVKILGLVENMSTFTCPKCNKSSEVFPASSGGVRQMATDFSLHVLAQLPLNPTIGQYCDAGRSLFEAPNSSSSLIESTGNSSVQVENSDLKGLIKTFLELKDKVISLVNQ